VSSAGFRIEIGRWAECAAGARAVRTAVFIDEQGIASEDEWDAADASALHALALHDAAGCIGTARLLRELPAAAGAGTAAPGLTVARIGRVAVLPAWRGRQVGVALMQALCACAQARGDTQVLLNAQCHAQTFYARLGFVAEGDAYDDAGIPHIAMRRAF